MDSPTKDVEVEAPHRKVAEFDRDVIENHVNDKMKVNKLVSSSTHTVHYIYISNHQHLIVQLGCC